MSLKGPQAKGKTVNHLIGDRNVNLDLLSIHTLSNQLLESGYLLKRPARSSRSFNSSECSENH